MKAHYEPKSKSIKGLKEFLERIESIKIQTEDLPQQDKEEQDDLVLNLVDTDFIDTDDEGKLCQHLIGTDFICLRCLNVDKVYKSATFTSLKVEDGVVEFKTFCRKCRARAVNKSIKKREALDQDYKFINKFRIAQASRLREIIKGQYKRDSFYKVIGCTKDEFLNHITSKLKDGMTIENYGRGSWSIDHLIPISWARDRNDIDKLSLYTNLAPKWESENSYKGNKWGEVVVGDKIVKITKDQYYNQYS
jgi:hypothetical protein